MSNRIKDAREFAINAHGNQERKYTGVAYTTHLEETAQLLWEYTDGKADTDMYVAALLHDVVEDTDKTLLDVGKHFGHDVMGLVGELTIDESEKEKEGKKKYLTRKINTMSDRAFLIKLCDRLNNVTGLSDKTIPNKFVAWYIRETQYILDNIERKTNDVGLLLLDRIQHTLLAVKLERDL